MSLWKRTLEQRLDNVERRQDAAWRDERLADLERVVADLRAVTFPAVAREYFAKRVLYVGEGMTDEELLDAVRADIETRRVRDAWSWSSTATPGGSPG